MVIDSLRSRPGQRFEKTLPDHPVADHKIRFWTLLKSGPRSDGAITV
jgi:hypothetical protein